MEKTKSNTNVDLIVDAGKQNRERGRTNKSKDLCGLVACLAMFNPRKYSHLWPIFRFIAE